MKSSNRMTWLYRTLSVLCLLSFIFTSWILYYFIILFRGTPQGIWLPIVKTIVPALPVLLTLIVTSITAWRERIYGTILLLLFSIYIGSNCISNLTSNGSIFSFYWVSTLASIFALLAIILNLIIFIIFIYNRFVKS
jgi:hypothetical protein